jgi:hypothetical protein
MRAKIRTVSIVSTLGETTNGEAFLINGAGTAWNALAAKLTYTSVLAAALALTVGAHANAQVTSDDIVDGQVKTSDIASAAVTAPKIAGNAVTGAKIAGNAVTGAKVQDGSLTGIDIQDGSITGADIDESTLRDVNASELNGFNANELIRIGEAAVTSVVDLPDCSPGLAYLTKTITVPFTGNVLVTAMFTAQANGSNTSRALAARVERHGVVVEGGVWAEDHTAYGSPSQRSNLVSTEMFGVASGDNTFVLRVCDSSDTDLGAAAIRGTMTLVYTPAPSL